MKKNLLIHFFVQTVNKQGTFFRFHNLALGLKELGHTVKVFGATYTKGEKSRIENIDGIEYNITSCYFPLQQFFGQYAHPMAAFKRTLKKYPKCDVAHVFQPSISAYLPWYMNRRKAVQNVYDWDDLWTDGLAQRGNTFAGNWLYRQVKYIEKKGPQKSDYTIACSNFLSKMADDFGASQSEIIYNGYWHYTPNNKNTARKNLKLSPDTFYIGFMGRTINEISWCFNLLEEALKHYPDIRLALCGMPKEAMNDIDKRLLDKTDYLGFLAPLVTRDFASAIDIGLLPLDNSTFNQSRFPIKFAEYLAAGAPVFCTSVGECSSIARQFPFVKIAKPDNESWISEGVKMIGDVMQDKWPAVDKQKTSAILGWENISQKLESIYLKKN